MEKTIYTHTHFGSVFHLHSAEAKSFPSTEDTNPAWTQSEDATKHLETTNLLRQSYRERNIQNRNIPKYRCMQFICGAIRIPIPQCWHLDLLLCPNYARYLLLELIALICLLWICQHLVLKLIVEGSKSLQKGFLNY